MRKSLIAALSLASLTIGGGVAMANEHGRYERREERREIRREERREIRREERREYRHWVAEHCIYGEYGACVIVPAHWE